MIPNPQSIVHRLIEFQATVRDIIVLSHRTGGMHEINRVSSADTIYKIDTLVEPILEDFCRQWAKTTPLILIAEGIDDEHGNEGAKVFPEGSSPDDALIRLIVDPIDGTRGLMYDKRAAWALAAVAPNKGPGTRLRDIEVSVMTELPTTKMGHADVLWAIKGQGSQARRVDLSTRQMHPLNLCPSAATTVNHGFAMVVNFFPATKVLAAQLMEHLAHHLIDAKDLNRATLFDDQYISTGGQFYELIAGHDRFNADLRPLLYAMQAQPEGLCCHPYDCAGLLIAEEAGVIITDGQGQPLDGPMDVTTGISWAAFANPDLRKLIEPILTDFLQRKC